MRELEDTQTLGFAPAQNVGGGKPPYPTVEGAYTYLWVIDHRGIPYVLDEDRQDLDGERPKHTNLTRGGNAYVGGEMWFKTGYSMWVSGNSGRYGPRCRALLEDSVDVFRSYGYEVQSLGWDDEANRPNLFLECS